MKKLKIKKNIEMLMVIVEPGNLEEINSMFNPESTPDAFELEWDNEEDGLAIYEWDGENFVKRGDVMVFYKDITSGFIVEYEVLPVDELLTKYEEVEGENG